ncbi:unnamed protein product [Rotaria magnacalcarata]|uniref:Recombining binding protein suppressor of hairless n=8 Tax=Rotaria magnacalcarata TaxID=392030 RepID=A0A816LHP2_9BILA|nr:unnamed protein product [Rotaria magnacalcarata]
MVNMQLAMYQMLTNFASNSTPQQNSSLRFRSLSDHQSPIINHQKPIKRLCHKRPRLVKTNNPTSSGTTTAAASSLNMPTTSSPVGSNGNYNDESYEELEHRPLTREIMATYLSTRRHRKVTVHHAKVAQKSYGNEKRFFCPPPCVYLSGDGWNHDFEQDNLCTMIGIGEPLYLNDNNGSPSGNITQSSEMQHLPFDNGKRFGAAKTLFISDSDKRKHINLNVKMMYTADFRDSPYIGMFESRKIKVISKPSKKKQSVKNAESVCIQSGTKIALFNRLRSQNVSTRFLHVDERNQFEASSHEWGSFYIHLVDNEEPCMESTTFSVKEGFVQYGSTVKLVCSVTNQSLPYMVIRKVDKNRVLLDSDEPVSQLHKCAFEFKNGPSSSSSIVYLCLTGERIVGIAGKPCPNERFRVDINDSACWTIISTDKAEYTWFEACGPVSHPITPVPVARHIVVDGGGTAATIELTGENFAPGLSVWFGETESPCTNYQSTQTIVADVPQFSSVMPNMPWIQRSISTPISLVRRDGVVYLTPLMFTYTPQPAPPRKNTPSPPAVLSVTSENIFCE